MEIINHTNPGAEPVDGDLIERRYPNGAIEQVQYWSPAPDPGPPPVRPRLVVTALAVDAEHAAQSLIDLAAREITAPVGAEASATVEIRDGDDNVLLIDATFRMPITASDGRERLSLATFQGGQATIRVPLRESGVWRVTETEVNKRLPPEQQMQFDGVTVYAVD